MPFFSYPRRQDGAAEDQNRRVIVPGCAGRWTAASCLVRYLVSYQSTWTCPALM